MYKRDVLILLVACVAMLVSLRNEGSFSFRKAWYHVHSSNEEDSWAVEHHLLPPPLVADLNGDGHFEIVTATPNLKIQVMHPQPAGRPGEGFAGAQVINEVSLLYKRVVVMAGRRPVAMAVGYLDPLPRERVRPPRKQVVVVVTASWQVLCFDHNLKLMWESDVKESFPHHSHIKEVAVFVAPHRVHGGDRGLVVVGASVERGDIAGGEGLEGDDAGTDRERAFSDDDVLREEMRLEEEERSHARSAGKDAPLSDLDRKDPARGLDTSRHFDYVAFEGGTGTQRWHHNPTDFHKDLDSLADKLKPLSEFKLGAEQLEGRHFGEVSCRDYRESLLHVLPHAWSSPLDTHLEEAHFIRRREGKGAQRSRLAARHKKGHHKPGRVASRVVAEAPLAGLLSGAHPATRRHRTTRHRTKHSAHPGGTASARHAASTHWVQRHNFTANTLVAYLEEGVEVVHLFSGRPVCQLHLPPGSLHADIDGDGVLDHVQVFHGTASDDDPSNTHCMAVATSGIPPRERLWEVNVCRNHRFLKMHRTFGQAEDDDGGMELLTPILLPLPQLGAGGYLSHRAQHGLVIFATSLGEISAVNSKGEIVWSTLLPVHWRRESDLDEGTSHVVPTLAPLSLRRHAVPTAVLVSGSLVAQVLSEHGHVLETILLPHPPSQPLVVADFNGDGLIDIIAVTPNGIFGYQQVAHMGGTTLSALLGTLIVAMAVVYYTQLSSAGGVGLQAAKQRKLRSTEFTD